MAATTVRRLVFGFLLATGIVSLLAAPGPAQLAPGDIVTGDSSGNLWRLDVQSGVPTLFAKLPSAVYAIEVDYHGDLICGGSAILWKVTSTGQISTILQGTPLTSLQGDVEVNQNGNFYVSSMGSPSIWEMTHQGVVITTYTITVSTRSWGLGIDPRDGTIYVAGYSTIHKINPGTGQVQNIATGSPFTFLENATFGPQGAFVVADQNSDALYAIDPVGQVTTVYAGKPLGDVEGVDLHYSGVYVLSDSSPSVAGGNAVFLVTTSSPAVLTTLSAGSPLVGLNGCAVVPALHVARASANPRPGQKAYLAIASNGAARDPYVFASSLSAGQGIPLGHGLRFPLDPDPLFFATAQNLLPGLFQNYSGILDIAGSAGLTIQVPNIPALAGITLHTAGLTLNRNTLTGVHLISNVETVTIEP